MNKSRQGNCHILIKAKLNQSNIISNFNLLYMNTLFFLCVDLIYFLLVDLESG